MLYLEVFVRSLAPGDKVEPRYHVRVQDRSDLWGRGNSVEAAVGVLFKKHGLDLKAEYYYDLKFLAHHAGWHTLFNEDVGILVLKARSVFCHYLCLEDRNILMKDTILDSSVAEEINPGTIQKEAASDFLQRRMSVFKGSKDTSDLAKRIISIFDPLRYQQEPRSEEMGDYAVDGKDIKWEITVPVVPFGLEPGEKWGFSGKVKDFQADLMKHLFEKFSSYRFRVQNFYMMDDHFVIVIRYRYAGKKAAVPTSLG